MPQAENVTISSFLTSKAGSRIDPESLKASASPSAALSWVLRLNDHISSGTTVSFAHNRLCYRIRDAAQQPVGTVKGSLQAYELIGSLRFTPHSFFHNAVQPYLCLGYGWSVYTAENAMLNGEPFKSSTTVWPSLKPNTYHVGMGLDLSSKKRVFSERLGVSELGVRLESARYWNRMGERLPENRGGGSIVQDRIGMSILFGYR